MSSKKRARWAQQKAEFAAGLGDGLDGVFAGEGARVSRNEQQHDEALRRKACTSKKRYRSKVEAEAAIFACAEHGTTGLHCYECPHCGGWHLTSKPERPF